MTRRRFSMRRWRRRASEGASRALVAATMKPSKSTSPDCATVISTVCVPGEIALATGVADIGGIWSLERVTALTFSPDGKAVDLSVESKVRLGVKL